MLTITSRQSDTSTDKRKVERTRSRSEGPSVNPRVTEILTPSPQVITAPTVSVACVTAATCTTSTITTVSTPISSLGTRPPFQFAVGGTGQHVKFAQPISASVTGSTVPVQMSFFPTQSGIAPKKPLYKECQKCHHGKTLSVADGHQLCIYCLGPDHCLVQCHFCNMLPNKALIERARRLIWWRSKDLPVCPSARHIREIVARPAGTPEILDDAHVAARILEVGTVPLSTPQSYSSC